MADSRSGYGFIRTIILALLWVIPCAVLNISIVLKLEDLWLGRQHHIGIWELSPTVLLLGLFLEITICAWVLSSYRKRLALHALLTLFFVYTLVNIVSVVSGAEDCGCYGSRVELNPLWSALFDIVLVVSLFFAARSICKDVVAMGSVFGMRFAFAYLLCGNLTIGIVYVYGDVSQQSENVETSSVHEISDQNLFQTDSGLSRVRSGRWTLVFYRPFCSHCREEMPRWKTLAQSQRRGDRRWAFIQVGDDETTDDLQLRLPMPSVGIVHLRAEKEWNVPFRMHVDDGIITDSWKR